MRIINLFKNQKDFFYNYLFISFSIFPICLMIGNLVINTFILLNSIFIIFFYIFRKNIKFEYKDKFFILLILFFISLVVNLIFSQNFYLSLPRVLKFFFIIFFILSLKELINQSSIQQIEKIFKIWSMVFLVVIFDLCFEFFRGENIIGLSSNMSDRGRLSSFTGSESVIGAYFHGFVLFFLSYLFLKYPNNNLFNISFVFIVLVVSFLIGERSNFIKTFIIVILFSLITYRISVKIKVASILGVLTSLIIFLSVNDEYNKRYVKQLPNLLSKDSLTQYLAVSNYGRHYNVAKQIFYNHPYFGVGIKNFRVESYKRKYESKPNTWTGGTTHPHQVHYEFLSETGIFGYFIFLLFIFLSLYYGLNEYLKNKNVYLLSSILYLISNLVPIIPSGSFFTTYFSSIFWINYAVMISFSNIKSKV